MIKELQLRILPEEAVNEQSLRQVVARETGEAPKNIRAVRVLKRSIDARQRTIFVNVKLRVFMNEMPSEPEYQLIEYKDVSAGKPVIVVGAGPGGLFAALRLIELGLRPIIVERGKDVRERKKDIALISREHKVNGESNYSFGEGGAGAYSDGKLYTRSKKRGSVDKILNIFCQFGASPSILADAHPHIGTDKLPRVIENIREQIKRCGGEVHFETRMDAFIMKENEVIGIETNTGKSFYGPVILATGHSARDVYNYLYERQIQIEAKGIAVGVRLEHHGHGRRPKHHDGDKPHRRERDSDAVHTVNRNRRAARGQGHEHHGRDARTHHDAAEEQAVHTRIRAPHQHRRHEVADERGRDQHADGTPRKHARLPRAGHQLAGRRGFPGRRTRGEHLRRQLMAHDRIAAPQGPRRQGQRADERDARRTRNLRHHEVQQIRHQERQHHERAHALRAQRVAGAPRHAQQHDGTAVNHPASHDHGQRIRAHRPRQHKRSQRNQQRRDEERPALHDEAPPARHKHHDAGAYQHRGLRREEPVLQADARIETAALGKQRRAEKAEKPPRPQQRRA